MTTLTNSKRVGALLQVVSLGNTPPILHDIPSSHIPSTEHMHHYIDTVIWDRNIRKCINYNDKPNTLADDEKVQDRIQSPPDYARM